MQAELIINEHQSIKVLISVTHASELVSEEERSIYKAIHTVSYALECFGICLVIDFIHTLVPTRVRQRVNVVGKVSTLCLHHDQPF